MTLAKINANSVSLAGEFAVLSQLALRGYDANGSVERSQLISLFQILPTAKCISWK